VSDPLGFLAPDARRALEELVARVVDERLAEVERGRDERDLLTVAEAADRLRAKPQRVYDLLSDGRLQGVHDGSRRLIQREELDRYLAGEPPPRRPARRLAAPGNGRRQRL
jgi:excisionase family DNA binding protein